MAKTKYRVVTKCQNCGKVYTTKAKKNPRPPEHCKKCNSRKTISLRSYKA